MSQNIKDVRLQLGLNRKEFSQKLNIPYMTLTDWELGKHEPPEYVHRLLEYYVRIQCSYEKSPYFATDKCNKWDEQRNYRTTFPTVHNHSTVPVKYIYPLKQRDIINIHEAVKDDTRINNIILFGSSVTMRCTKSSDIDLSVRLNPDYIDNTVKNDISDKIQEACNYNADIIWFDRINSNDRVYANITKGVQIV